MFIYNYGAVIVQNNWLIVVLFFLKLNIITLLFVALRYADNRVDIIMLNNIHFVLNKAQNYKRICILNYFITVIVNIHNHIIDICIQNKQECRQYISFSGISIYVDSVCFSVLKLKSHMLNQYYISTCTYSRVRILLFNLHIHFKLPV